MSLFIINKTIALKKALVVPGVLSTVMVGTEAVDMQPHVPVSAQSEAVTEPHTVLTSRGYRWVGSDTSTDTYILTAQLSSGNEMAVRRVQRDSGPAAPAEALDWGLAGTQRQLSRQE